MNMPRVCYASDAALCRMEAVKMLTACRSSSDTVAGVWEAECAGGRAAVKTAARL